LPTSFFTAKVQELFEDTIVSTVVPTVLDDTDKLQPVLKLQSFISSSRFENRFSQFTIDVFRARFFYR
jgi:hypothetical protein